MGSLCASTNARVPVVSPLFLTPSYLLHSSRDDVADDGGGICFRWVSLDVSLTGPTEVTKNEVQVLLGHEGYRAHDAVLCVDGVEQCVLGCERQHRAKPWSRVHSIVRVSSTGSAAAAGTPAPWQARHCWWRLRLRSGDESNRRVCPPGRLNRGRLRLHRSLR